MSQESKRDTVFPGSNLGKPSARIISRSRLPTVVHHNADETLARGFRSADSAPQKSREGLRTLRQRPSDQPSIPTAYEKRPSEPLSVGEPPQRPASPSTPSNTLKPNSKSRTSSAAYHEYMILDQAGLARCAVDNTEAHNLVAVKTIEKISPESCRRVHAFTSDQVVSIREVFLENEDLVIIYERMDITLRRVTSVLTVFKSFQIAAICRELVAGLSFVHGELSTHHGELDCASVLLSRDGTVKIANIGESLVRNQRTTKENQREDVHSIGFIMMELMEPDTYMLNGRSADLRHPERWKDGLGIKDFLKATQSQPLRTLQKHDFLPKESLSKCLKAHVDCAVWAAGTDWEIGSLP